MSVKDSLHEAISDDNTEEATKILQDFAMRWFTFGMGVGICIASIILGFVIINK